LEICIQNQGSISYTINNNIFPTLGFILETSNSPNYTISTSFNNNIFYISIPFFNTNSNLSGVVTENNNQFKATSSIFVSPTGQSTDGQWQVLQNSSSVAYKAGTDGTDCGMFGGTLPYTLSGLPAIPSIATINITGGSTVTSNNFSFSIGAQSNK